MEDAKIEIIHITIGMRRQYINWKAVRVMDSKPRIRSPDVYGIGKMR